MSDHNHRAVIDGSCEACIAEREAAKPEAKEPGQVDLEKLGDIAHAAYFECPHGARESFRWVARAVLEAAGVDRLRERATKAEDARKSTPPDADTLEEILNVLNSIDRRLAGRK